MENNRGIAPVPCACMGPQGNDPLCPCQMISAGLTPTDIWTEEKRAELSMKLAEVFGKKEK